MYSKEEALSFQRMAVECKLKYPAEFINMEPSELVNIANGYGPQRWPESFRKAVNWFFRHYPAAAAIHDLRYELSDGREPTRRAADAEFSANMLILWHCRYRWQIYCNPVAWFDRWKLRSAGQLTARFGKAAWRAGWMKNRSKKREVTFNE